LDDCLNTLGLLLMERETRLHQPEEGICYETTEGFDKKKRDSLAQVEGKCERALQGLVVLLGRDPLDKALSLCSKKRSVTKYVCESSRRSCYNVHGQLGTYLLFDSCDKDENFLYCSCHSFAQRYNRPQPYCKHIIALRLVRAMGNLQTLIVKDTEFPIYLSR